MKRYTFHIALALIVVLAAMTIASTEVWAQREVRLAAGDTETIGSSNGKSISAVVSTDAATVSGAILPGKKRMTVVGVSPGSATLVVSYSDGSSEQIQVSVTYSGMLVRELADALSDMQHVSIRSIGERLLLEGTIYSNAEWERYRRIVDSSGFAAIDLVTLAADQVNIQIDAKISEVNLRQLRELGIDWLNLTDGIIQLAEPDKFHRLFPDADKLLGPFGRVSPISAAVNALEEKGVAYALARPSAVCTSGGEAQFTDGGEVPVLTSNINGTTVQYRDFGVILRIEPTLVSFEAKTMRLVVDAELSDVDETAGTREFPAFSSRKVHSDIIVKDGETIAIAGLLSVSHQEFESKLPVLGWIPVLGGLLFGSTRTETIEKETIILITPRLITAKHGENIKFDRDQLERDKKELMYHPSLPN